MSLREADLDALERVDAPQDEAPEPDGAHERVTPPPRDDHVAVPLVAASAFLATAAAGWTVAGLFAGVLPRLAALFAAGLGAGWVGLAAMRARRRIWQALALPAVLLVAVVLALLGGGADGGLVAAVRDALQGGGPSGEPLAFSAGWRLLVVAFVGALGAGACSLALSSGRPRVAVVVPVVPLILATLVQPKGTMVSSGVPAMTLMLGALAAAYGVELAAEGATSTRFELRRLARGLVAIAGIAVFLVGVSRAGFLFPVPDQERVIPPQLPPVTPPMPDRELFTVRAPSAGPWRLGVLDVYDGTAWRLPPYDPARFVPVTGGAVPARATGARTFEATFTITGLSGPVLPAPASPRSIAGVAATFDPRTQVLRTADRTDEVEGAYTVVAPVAPTGRQLATAPAAPAQIAREFTAAPAPPAQVTTLLAGAPRAPAWDRLQYVRAQFYGKVVASGAGRPTAVPPARAAAILAGKPANPYEISAAEALLARWAGVPARIGYGFFEGDKRAGVYSIRPRHAATWLEVYFEGHGWVPVVGVPPRAQQSLEQQRQQTNPRIRPTDQLALVLYVPVRLSTVRLLYEVARYWIMVSLPFVIATLLAWAFYPGAVKAVRSLRRRRWASQRGAAARIAVAYAELRDTATDLNVGNTSMSPFEFTTAVASDAELVELTWLVSRALWGDLRRDLRDDDAEEAERMARSVARRLRRAQPAPTRVLAVSSRASLREPYMPEVPNLWRAPRRRRRLVAATASVLALVLAASCASPAPVSRPAGAALPERIVPAALGDVAFRHEPAVERRLKEVGDASLIDAARVYTFLSGGVVQGYLEVGSFRSDVSSSLRDLRRGVLDGVNVAWKLTRAGAVRVYTARDDNRSLALWFAPDGTYFELLVSRAAYGEALPVLARVLSYQGHRVGDPSQTNTLTPVDPRRGMPL